MSQDPGPYDNSGSVRDFEEGTYPSRPDIESNLIDKNKMIATESIDDETNDHSLDVSLDGRRDEIDRFTGVLLDCITPHNPNIYWEESKEDIHKFGYLFVARKDDVRRVKFWNDAAERVINFSSKIGDTVRAWGYEQRGKSMIEINVGNPQTGVAEVNETIDHELSSADPSTIEPRVEVPAINGTVLEKHKRTHRSGDESFDVTHVALESNGQNVLLELHDQHASLDIDSGRSVWVFGAYGKEFEYIDSSINHYNFETKIWARNYSGVYIN